MIPYDQIRAQIEASVPFAAHTGVRLVDLGDGTATAVLDQRPETSNHIGSQHAGAMFTLAEAASGAALAGALAPVIWTMRPVAASAQIAYKRIAKGTLTAHAKTARTGADLIEDIEKNGKVAFDIVVDVRDADDETVVEMTVNWYVSPNKG